nr:MAG TPA: hypothetical protein [Caudoviricetes sp.]
MQRNQAILDLFGASVAENISDFRSRKFCHVIRSPFLWPQFFGGERCIKTAVPRGFYLKEKSQPKSLSIFQLVFQNVSILPRMVGGSGLQKRLCLVAVGHVPVALRILIHPRRRPSAAALGVNAGTKLDVSGILIIRSNNCRRFLLVYHMGNAVSQNSGIHGAQLFRISLCHQPAFFKPAQQRRLDFSGNLRTVILDCNAHLCKYPSPRFCRSHSA